MMTLPDAYRQYMQNGRLIEGELSCDPGWFQLWPLEECEQLNQDYEVAEYLPGFTAFGSNGGGELLAFDPQSRIVMVPFVPMEKEEAEVVAQNWAEFESQMITEPGAEGDAVNGAP